jgi:hypothetical protein
MNQSVRIHIPLKFSVRGSRKVAILADGAVPVQPKGQNALVSALARAHRWRSQIENGDYATITELAKENKVNQSYACRLLRLSLLAPSLVADILNGRQNSKLTLKELTKPFPPRWDRQFSVFSLSE